MTTFEKLFGDKFSKFRLGQLLFVTAVTFGLFTGDIIRIVFGVFALFCLTKENFMFTPWTKEQKITGVLLALFCAWMIIIPVIFGENPLNVRLRDAVRPLELTLWICATFLFAKDEFFVRNLKNFSITACFCYALIALKWCFDTKFALVYTTDNWPIIRSGYGLGTLMSIISVWTIYQLVTTEKAVSRVFCFIALLLAFTLDVLCKVTIYWVTLAVELCMALFLSAFFNKKMFRKLLSCLLFTAFISGTVLFAGYQKSPTIHFIIQGELNNFKTLESLKEGKAPDIETLTSNRVSIWIDAVKAVRQKPLFGHGREVFVYYCTAKLGHAHNTFLHGAFEAGIPIALIAYAIWLSIFFMALKRIFETKSLPCMPFVATVVISGFMIGSIAANYYLTDRTRLIAYWSIYLTMLATYNAKETTL